MNKTLISIDNGISGSIFILGDDIKMFYKTPTKIEQNYTKKKQNITRLNGIELKRILSDIDINNCLAVLERPMVNPQRWKASMSAIRCLEATLIVLEDLQISIRYIDSRKWQKVMLPLGVRKEELKKSSCDIACRLFPIFKEQIIKHKDGDSLLMAEYCRRNNW